MTTVFDAYTVPEIINKYGMPNSPSCIRYCPTRNITFIGTNNGLIEIYNGATRQLKYSIELPELPSITQINIIKNNNQIIIIANLCVYLLEYTAHYLSIIDILTFKNERVTFSYLLDDIFIFIGTIKGNVYIVHIKENKLNLKPYAIFWNISCKGYTAMHPGAVTFISSCADRQKLYIVLSNGIISTFSLSDKHSINVSNAYEKFYSCAQLDENTIVMGCDNSAVLCFDLKTQKFSRQNFSTDYKSTGSVWKVATPYDILLKCKQRIIACAGGLSLGPDDVGGGVSIFIDDAHLILSNDILIDFSFTISPNDQLSLIGLFADRIVLFNINLQSNKPSFDISNYLNIEKRPLEICSVLSLISTSLQLNIYDKIRILWEKLKNENIKHEIQSVASSTLPFLLVFLGLRNGGIKLYLCDNELFLPIEPTLQTSDETPVMHMEYLAGTNFIISYHFSCHAHINVLNPSTGTRHPLITINLATNDSIQYASNILNVPVKSHSTDLSPSTDVSLTPDSSVLPTPHSWISCQTILLCPTDFLSQGVLGYIYETKNLLFYINDYAFIFDLEKGLVLHKFQVNLIIDQSLKEIGIFSKSKYAIVFNPEQKIKGRREIYCKKYFIIDGFLHKITFQKEIMNLLMLLLSCGALIAIVFDVKFEVYSCDTIYHNSSSAFIKILALDEKDNQISSLESCSISSDTSPSIISRVIIVEKHSITSFNLNAKLEKDCIVTPLPVGSLFTSNIQIVNGCLVCLNSNNHLNIFDMENLKDMYHIKLDVNFLKSPDLKSPIVMIKDSNFLHLVAVSSEFQLTWFSLDKNQIIKYKRLSSISLDETPKINSNIFKQIAEYITDKTSNLEATFSNCKDIMVNAVATSSVQIMHSQIMINADERRRKLAKAAMESEKLALHAAAFKKTATEIAEKAKRGEL